MKRILFSAGTIFCAAISVNAQTPDTSSTQQQKQQDRFTEMVLGQYSGAKASRTTLSTGERLVAQCGYGGYVPVSSVTDSSIYIYSGNNNSHFDFNGMGINNFFSSQGNIFLRYKNPEVWQSLIHCDKSYVWGIYLPPYTFMPNDTTYATYTTNGKVASFVDTSMNRFSFYNMYNMAGLIESSLSILRTSVLTPYENRFFYYNAAGSLVMDSTSHCYAGVWVPTEKYTYAYNSINKITDLAYSVFNTSSMAWDTNQKYIVDYYSDDRVQQIRRYNISDTGIPRLSYIDSFGWTPSVDYYTYRKMNNVFMMAYLTFDKHVNTATLLPDSIFRAEVYVSSGLHIDWVEAYNYDSYLQPIHQRDYHNSSTGTYDSLTALRNFYYETYDNTEVPTTAAATSIKMTVFPNPTNSDLTIQFAGLQTNSGMHLKLINAVGQTIIDKQSALLNNTTQLSLSDIASGVYWLIAEDAATHMVCRQAVVKQ